MSGRGHRRWRVIGLVALCFAGKFAPADERPTTAPTTTEATRPASQPAVDDAVVDDLIAQLGDPNYEARQRAETGLLRIGRGAAPALREAAQSGDPELARRAGRVLVRIPWEDRDDPPAVRDILRGYVGKSDEDRTAAFHKLRALQPSAGRDAACRVVCFDPSPDVRWSVINAYFDEPPPTDPRVLAELRDSGSAAGLALAGWALQEIDYPKAIALFQRAFDAMSLDEVRTAGQSAKVIYDALVSHYKSEHDYPAAARIVRRQCDAFPMVADDLGRSPVDELLALHAEHPPLTGLLPDLARALPGVARPPTLFALGQVARQHRLPPIASAAFAAARAACGQDQGAHYATGDFLVDRYWDDLAAAELRRVVELDDAPANSNATNAHFRLALVAGRQGDDATACREYAVALQRAGNNLWVMVGGRRMSGDEARRHDLMVMHQHGFRAAMAAHDADGQLKHALPLAEMLPQDTSIATYAVPVLHAAGHDAEADRLFGKAYDAAKAAVDAEPADANRHNYLAWLCASCGERLPEAMEHAHRAVELQPDNADNVDTLAECHFRLGQSDEAVRLEERAIELKPANATFREQLRRFRSDRPPATRPSR